MYADVNDVIRMFRPLSNEEKERVEALLPIVEDTIRQYAINVNRNIDKMIEEGVLLEGVVKSVVVDVVSRTILSDTHAEPMTQMSQSALGYVVSGTYANPGGGIYIKKSELSRLGLRRQRVGAIEL